MNHFFEARFTRFLFTLVNVLAGWSLVLPSTAMGLTINLTFDSSTSYLDANGVDRTNDLPGLMQAAAQMWEDMIKDNHTLNLTYRWDDLSGTTLGLNEWSWPSGGNRPNQSTITLDTHQGTGGAAR